MNFSISFVQTKICLGVFVFNCWFTRKKCVGANPEFVVTIVICHNHCAIDWRAAAVEARAGETLLCQYFAIVWHFAGVSVWATGRRPFRQLFGWPVWQTNRPHGRHPFIFDIAYIYEPNWIEIITGIWKKKLHAAASPTFTYIFWGWAHPWFF